MSGHASPSESREIEAREKRLDPALSPIDDLLELALLYVEPAHREDEAIRLLEAVLQRDPFNGEARLWLAYILLHFRMDAPALARARDAVTPLLDTHPYGGAATLLLAEVRDEQGAGLAERIHILERSVAQEPDWVSNRQDLSRAYSEAGRNEDALEQLRRALNSISSVDPTWTGAKRNFEESITGRTAFGAEARLRQEIYELSV